MLPGRPRRVTTPALQQGCTVHSMTAHVGLTVAMRPTRSRLCEKVAPCRCSAVLLFVAGSASAVRPPSTALSSTPNASRTAPFAAPRLQPLPPHLLLPFPPTPMHNTVGEFVLDGTTLASVSFASTTTTTAAVVRPRGFVRGRNGDRATMMAMFGTQTPHGGVHPIRPSPVLDTCTSS